MVIEYHQVRFMLSNIELKKYKLNVYFFILIFTYFSKHIINICVRLLNICELILLEFLFK